MERIVVRLGAVSITLLWASFLIREAWRASDWIWMALRQARWFA